MSDEIIYLNIPNDVAEYARRFGARRDASGQWYIVSAVPRELSNFLPRSPNSLFYERIPSCPMCGALMRRIQSRTGNLLWLCTARGRTGCDGSILYEDYLQKVEPVTTLGDFLPQMGTLLLPAAQHNNTHEQLDPKLPHPLRERWIAIVQRAFEVLGSERQVMLWLEQPKVALGLKAPIQMLGSVEGCAAAAQLLEELKI